MTDGNEAELPKPQMQDHRPRCPACAAFPRLAQSLLDTRKGKTVRLYQCRCGERIWDDSERERFQRPQC
jgi:hypothetical protein